MFGGCCTPPSEPSVGLGGVSVWPPQKVTCGGGTHLSATPGGSFCPFSSVTVGFPNRCHPPPSPVRRSQGGWGGAASFWGRILKFPDCLFRELSLNGGQGAASPGKYGIMATRGICRRRAAGRNEGAVLFSAVFVFFFFNFPPPFLLRSREAVAVSSPCRGAVGGGGAGNPTRLSLAASCLPASVG